MEKLDLLCFAAHPDDTELACSGTILHHIHLGYKVGIVDLTQGELGTRGSAELRAIEAANSAKILGISTRDNLRLADGFFRKSDSLTRVIEKYANTNLKLYCAMPKAIGIPTMVKEQI